MIKVLYISQKPIFPQVDGGTQAMKMLFDALNSCEGIELTYAPLCTKKHPHKETQALHKSIHLFPLEITTTMNFSKLSRFFSSIPLNVQRYKDVSAQKKLESLLSSKRFDWVVCDGFYALTLIPENLHASMRILYRSHNIESHYWQYRKAFERSWKKHLFAYVHKKMVTYEKKIVALPDVVLSIALDETEILKQWNPNTHVFLPHVEDVVVGNNPYLNTTKSIGFVGDFHWYPNELAINTFLQNIWPSIRAEIPEVQLQIAGKNSEQFHNPSFGIQGLGFVKDLGEFYGKQQLIINPVQYGSGFNMKIIDALTYNKPMVLFAHRAKGLEHLSCFTLVRDEEEFAQALLKRIRSTTNEDIYYMDVQNAIAKEFNIRDRVQQLEAILHAK